MNKQELKDKIFEKSWEENQAEYLIKLEDLFEILDDYETLSQEWIRENQYYSGSYQLVDGEYYIAVKDLQNLILPPKRDQLEEAYEDIMSRKEFWFGGKQYKVVEVSKEETVIPSFVADFVTWTKDWTLTEIFDEEWLYEAQDDVAKWLYDNDKDTNQERELMLVTARSRGYEIEQEPKYVVELPNPNSDKSRYTNTFLNKNKGKVFIDSANLFANDISKYTQFALTEQEIKDYDERYFQFAVPVEEADANG